MNQLEGVQSLYICRGICVKSSSTGNIDCQCPLISKISFVDAVFCFVNDMFRCHFFHIQASLILTMDDFYLWAVVMVM